jgi:hypothetical protein
VTVLGRGTVEEGRVFKKRFYVMVALVVLISAAAAVLLGAPARATSAQPI